MKHSPAVLLVLLLARILVSPDVFAQQTDSTAVQDPPSQTEEVRGVALEQNYPNPFRDETRIPFVLGEGLFQDGQPVVVTVRIYNVLRQMVAVPTALDHPTAAGLPAQDLKYESAGRYELYWDGRDGNGQPVSSGIYFVQIIANRSTDVRKMIVTR